MYLESEIHCGICGARHSKSGKPFDRASLAKHMAWVHPANSDTYPPSELICDICGVNQSSTGKRFTQPSQVWQHKKKRHPDALNMPTPPKNDALKFCPCCGFNLAVVHARSISSSEKLPHEFPFHPRCQ